MTALGYGIDVSSHQDPETLPWETFQGHVDFVLVRANYGTKLDARAKDHIRHAREIGAKIGVYGFFRPGQSWADEARALESVAESIKISTDDIVPALDIEDDPFSIPKEVSPAWEDGCRRIIERWCELYGDAMVYVTARGWSMLGKPEWVLHRPLWCAHYRDAPPATPGNMPATIHQHRVGPFVPNGPGGSFKPAELDQNRLLLPLPLIGYRPSDDDQARVRALVAENLRRAVQEPDDGDDEPTPVV